MYRCEERSLQTNIINSFNKYLMIIFCVPGTILSAWQTSMNQSKTLDLVEFTV